MTITRTFCAVVLAMTLTTGLMAQKGDKKTVAITTFFVDRQIDVSELSGNAALTAQILTMAKDTNFNLQPVLEEFKNTFFTEYSKHFTFNLKPEAEVTENKDYQAFDEINMLDFARPLVANGYKIMYPGGFLQKKENRNQNEMIKIFPDVDGVMFVFMSYGFVKKVAFGGMGAAGIRATCNIWLYNKEGKAVFKIAEGANSKGTVALVAGVPVVSVEKILPLCKDASKQLLEDLMDRLPKMAKKAGDKL
jgi:hypothetical protein